MSHVNLPTGLHSHGSSPVFTATTLPPKFLEEHELGAGRWGVLQVLEGSVWYVDLATGQDQCLTAPATLVIAPESPHRLRLDGSLRFRVEFFAEPQPGKAPGTAGDSEQTPERPEETR